MTSLATEAQELAISTGEQMNLRVRKDRAGFVTPLESTYGAVGDGATDDTAALVLAATAAVDLGFWLDGLGLTYGVSELALPVGLKLRNARFIELDPQGASTRKTVKCIGTGAAGESIVLEDVYVDRNGDGTGGSLQYSAGIWLEDVARVHVVRPEVTGNNKGSGILVRGAYEGGLIDSPNIHDIRHVYTSETDDVIQGVWLEDCIGLTVLNPRITNLGRTDLTTVQRDRYSRAVPMGGCVDCHIIGGRISRCDQGVDMTGGDGNNGCTVTGVSCSHLFSAPYKLANCAIGNVLSGSSAEHCGVTGVVVSGGSVTLAKPTQRNLVTGLVIRNCGTNGWYAGTGGTVMGIRLDRNSADATLAKYPKGVAVTGNLIFSDEGSSAFTLDATTNALTLATGIPISTGVRCRLTTGGSLAGTGLATGTDYYLNDFDPNTMTVKLSTSYINALDDVTIDITGAGTGAHTLTLFSDCDYGVGSTIDSTSYLDSAAPNEVWGNQISGMKTGDVQSTIYRLEARVKRSAAQSIPDGTTTAVVYNSTVSDPYALCTSATGVFTAPRSGFYSLLASLEFAAFAAGIGDASVETAPDASTWTAQQVARDRKPAPGVGAVLGLRPVWRGYLTRGYSIRVTAAQNSGGAVDLSVYEVAFRAEDRL